MKKTYSIVVDCANCANKIEEAVQKMDAVATARINFMMQKLKVEWKEGETPNLEAIRKLATQIEPDFEIEE